MCAGEGGGVVLANERFKQLVSIPKALQKKRSVATLVCACVCVCVGMSLKTN